MQVKNMTERQLLALITNNFIGDPKKGHGHDYVDYKDDILKQYWYLTTKKAIDKLNKQMEGEK